MVWAVGIELLVLAAMLVVPPVADLLGHRPPTLLGLAVAAGTLPAVLVVDAVAKSSTARHRRSPVPVGRPDVVLPPTGR